MKKWMGMAVTALATLTLTTSVIKADDESNANTEAAQESVDYSGEVRISGKTNRERLGQFNYLLRHNLGYDIYPQVVGFKGEKQKINIRYEGDQNNFKVYYSKSKEMQNFNTDKLKGAKTYATLTKKTYDSVDKAKAAVSFKTIDTKKLGSKIQYLKNNQPAVITKAAGGQTLRWNFGAKWESIVIGAGNSTTKKANKVATNVAKNGLPSINGKGVLRFDNDGSQIKWYDGKVVYTLETTSYKFGLAMIQALTNPEAQAKAESQASAQSQSE